MLGSLDSSGTWLHFYGTQVLLLYREETPQPIPWAKETLFQVLKSHPQDAGGTKSFGLMEDSSNFSATNMGRVSSLMWLTLLVWRKGQLLKARRGRGVSLGLCLGHKAVFTSAQASGRRLTPQLPDASPCRWEAWHHLQPSVPAPPRKSPTGRHWRCQRRRPLQQCLLHLDDRTKTIITTEPYGRCIWSITRDTPS